ncbi:acyl-CoA dehydrogenase family protein [Nocardia sp. NPDC059239]|uniref:acyl-CoA dehydrogenase family protein n=1 Tax=unclassified Nocardia TaxID=2637762 RepID=UPI003696C5FF
MSDLTDVVASLDPLFRKYATRERVLAAEGDWDAELWHQLDESGFTAIGVPEDEGGSGGDLAIACGVVRAAARFTAPVPLAESLILGSWLRSRCGLAHEPGPTAVAVVDRRVNYWATSKDLLIDIDLPQVAWGRMSKRVLVVILRADTTHILDVPRDRFRVECTQNLAGEPVDRLTATGLDPSSVPAVVVRGNLGEAIRQRGSLARTVMMSGAIDALIEMTCSYAREREQFGMPIARFQVVRHHLAALAAESAVAGAAADGAVAAVERGADLAAIAARVRVSQAAGTACRIAHQVHGAMGFTREHALHLVTRRLWAWRDEHGSQSDWELDLGRRLLTDGRGALWAMATEREPA